MRDHLATWPDPVLDAATARSALAELAGRSKPETPLDLADACQVAGIAIGMAQGSILPEIAAGVANKLLEWYPKGQIVVWGRSYEHVMAGRPHHMLAAATLSGWNAIQESLDAGRGHLWFHGEDISISHPGAIYLNLVNEVDLPGVAFETVPVKFVFEFGEYLRMPRLDFVGITHIHSLSAMEHSPAELPEMSGVVQPGSLEQDALREWFVAGFNRLAGHLLRWQSFMTRAGELRPAVQQHTNMTVGRILYVSAHLLASSERVARLADFWQLVDLYRGLRGGGIPDLFRERFWECMATT